MGFLSVLSFAHKLAQERVLPGDTVVDATVGGGVDTLFLAGLVGEGGRVYGFDVQREALDKTAARLAAANIGCAVDYSGSTKPDRGVAMNGEKPEHAGVGLNDEAQPRGSTTIVERFADPAHGGIHPRVLLVQRSHAEMAKTLHEQSHGNVAAVMFNLGYLPGFDQTVITTPESTLPALEAAFFLLRRGGIATIVVYPGHEGGDTEAAAVHNWASKLPGSAAQTVIYRMINRSDNAPYLIAVEKR